MTTTTTTPRPRYQVGDLVRVLPSRYWADGYQGLYTVVGHAGDDPDEYKLTRGDVRAWTHPRSQGGVVQWEVWINACRLEPWTGAVPADAQRRVIP
jgi:hypothetical protein